MHIFKTSSVAIAFKEKIPNTYDVVLDRVMMKFLVAGVEEETKSQRVDR